MGCHTLQDFIRLLSPEHPQWLTQFISVSWAKRSISQTTTRHRVQPETPRQRSRKKNREHNRISEVVVRTWTSKSRNSNHRDKRFKFYSYIWKGKKKSAMSCDCMENGCKNLLKIAEVHFVAMVVFLSNEIKCNRKHKWVLMRRWLWKNGEIWLSILQQELQVGL